jgi:Putative silver efflux pump
MDINLARQLVLERLIEVQEHLPPGSEPGMVPNSTGLGEVYQYYLEGPSHAGLDAAAVERELIEQRTVQDWVIRPFLKGTPGVIDINSQGGYVKQFQVLVEPELLHKYSLSWTTSLRPWRTTTRMPQATYWRPMPKSSLSAVWD